MLRETLLVNKGKVLPIDIYIAIAWLVLKGIDLQCAVVKRRNVKTKKGLSSDYEDRCISLANVDESCLT